LRSAPHVADQPLQLVGEPAVLAIEPARVLEQVVMLLVARQHLLTRELEQALTHSADFVGQLPCNRGHLLSR